MVLLLTMTLSCSQSEIKEANGKIIDVAGSVGGGRIIDISEVAEDIRYIPLETSAASLVGEYRSIHYENGTIYIRDRTDTLKMFDEEGKLLRKFCRRGRGPQEYSFWDNLNVTPKKGDILINTLDEHVSILKYDKEGKFIRKFNTPEDGNFKTMWPLWLDDNTYVATIGVFFDKPDYSAVVYDSLGQIKLLVPMPKLAPYQVFREDDLSSETDVISVGEEANPKPKTKCLFNPERTLLYRYKNKMRVVYETNDTVLSIGNNLQIDTPYIFNYGKYRNNSMDRSSIGGNTGKHVSLMGKNQILESEGFLFMRVALREFAHEPYEKNRAGGNGTYALTDSYAIFNKKNDKFSFLNQTEKGVLGFHENLMGGPPFWPTYISDDNSLVMMITAFSLIEYANSHKVSEKLAEIVKNLKDTDNPIVVIAK